MVPTPRDSDPRHRRPEATAGEGGRPIGFGLTAAATARDLDLSQVRLVVEDGLLMAFGPDGDPIPPAAFGEALALQPGAEVRLDDGRIVAAARAHAVLQAQLSGGSATPASAEPAARDAWIAAMLGLGPGPEPTPAEVLATEDRTCALTAIGSVLMVSPPGGDTFLLTLAKGSPADDGVVAHLTLDGAGTTPAEVASRVRRHAASEAGTPLALAEITLPEVGIALVEEGLELRTPIGMLRLADGHAGAAPVHAFAATGRPVGIGELRAALGCPPAAPASATGHDAAPADDRRVPQDDTTARSASPADGGSTDSGMFPAESLPPAGPDAAPDPAGATVTSPLVIEAPRPSDLAEDAITAVVLAGLPDRASLSPGIDQGGGRWLLSPVELGRLTVTMPASGPASASVRLTSIAVLDDGEMVGVSATETLRLVPRPVPLGLDEALGDAGEIDAILIRGLEAGAVLSAGAHDAAIGGWVLRPAELAGLTVRPPVGMAEPRTVAVMGITIRPVGRPEVRLLASIPVTFD